MPLNLLKPSKGFSIIEVVVAISILLIFFLTIITIFPFGSDINKNSQKKTIALNLARAKIEELTSKSYSELTLGIIEPRAKLSQNPEEELYFYERESRVSYVDPNQNLQETSQDLGIKKIETTVFWISPLTRKEKTYQLITLISEH